MAYYNITPTKLGQAAITGTIATLYTVPTGFRAFVKDLNICNTTSGAVTVNVHLVPKSGTAGTDNAILYTYSIAANTIYRWTGVQIMNESETIQVKGSTTGLTITASGAEAI
jgi:hypothetical protein